MATRSVLERRMKMALRRQLQRKMLWDSKNLGPVRKGEAWTKANDLLVEQRKQNRIEKGLDPR